MVGRVLERDQLERRVEAVPGDQAAVFHKRQQRFFQVIAVAGVVHVKDREVTLVRVGGDHGVQLPGLVGGPVLEFGGQCLPGKPHAQG